VLSAIIVIYLSQYHVCQTPPGPFENLLIWYSSWFWERTWKL